MFTDRKYVWEFGCSMLAYIIVTHFSILFLTGNPDSTWRLPITLTPIIPATCVVIAILRAMRRMDELQRRISLEAVTFAFFTSILASMSYGFLENIGFPPINWIWGGAGMVMLWAIGLVFSRRRYS